MGRASDPGVNGYEAERRVPQRRRTAGTPTQQATSDQMAIDAGSGAETSTVLSTLADATMPAVNVNVVTADIV